MKEIHESNRITDFELTVITMNELDKWEQIVKSFDTYDVYYLPEYVKAFEMHGDGEPNLVFYQDGQIRALNVVMKRDIAESPLFNTKIPPQTYFDFATPYGYGGFLIEGNINQLSIEKLNNEYTNYCKNQGIVSEFVRFHPVLNNCDSVKEIYDITRLGKTITMYLDSRETIWNLISSKNRNVIRKAKKSGVEIYWGRDQKLFKEFIKLYNATMDKDNADQYYYFGEEFYSSILNDLKYNSLIFYAVYQEKIIAMSIILFANQQMHYHLSGSDRNFQHLAPTNLLLYEAACWGCENGYRTFHLGGGLGSQEDNLFKFKKAFNKNSDTSFSIGKKIFDAEKYNQLFSIRSKLGNFDMNSNYFPLYRQR